MNYESGIRESLNSKISETSEVLPVKQIFDKEEFIDRLGGNEEFAKNIIKNLPLYMKDEIKRYIAENNVQGVAPTVLSFTRSHAICVP